MKHLAAASAILASFVAISSPAWATVVASASFETPALNSPGIQYGPDEFAFNTNEVGPVVIPGFTFQGFSGIIKNGSLGVFPDTAAGTQAAFLQSYQNQSAQIDWHITGLTPGQSYTLSFQDVASLVVPAEPFSVSAFGGAAVNFTPTGAYTTHTITFTPSTTFGDIVFADTALASNQASAIDNLILSTSAVPESSAWLLMFTGLGGAGAALRNGRRKVATLAL